MIYNKNMKALRNYRIKFHCQLGAIGMLAVVGLIAICGEPDAPRAFLEINQKTVYEYESEKDY